MWSNLQDHGLARGAFEETIEVVRRLHVATIHSQQILALFHVPAGLRERRAKLRIAAFAVVNAGEAVPTVLDAVIRAQQPATRRRLIGSVVADVDVAEREVAEHLTEQITQRPA